MPWLLPDPPRIKRRRTREGGRTRKSLLNISLSLLSSTQFHPLFLPSQCPGYCQTHHASAAEEDEGGREDEEGREDKCSNQFHLFYSYLANARAIARPTTPAPQTNTSTSKEDEGGREDEEGREGRRRQVEERAQ